MAIDASHPGGVGRSSFGLEPPSPRRRCRFWQPANTVACINVNSLALPRDFDQIAVVVDWLDACRRRDLDALLELYSPEASLECRCGGATVSEGRASLAAYWRPRLDGLAPNAFGLEEIEPTSDGVQLDYVNHEGVPVRMVFTFTGDGKVLRTRCAPAARTKRQDALNLQGQAG